MDLSALCFYTVRSTTDVCIIACNGFICHSMPLPERSVCYFRRVFVRRGKEPITFVMSVRPSLRTYQRGSHRTNFREIYYCVILRKSVEKLHFFFFFCNWERCPALHMKNKVPL